ncbi:MAG: TetR/AcrR family transcriptional regulator [Oscillibacter sp.]|nr:TetR/AcrR family transcriptional regulator [Oscillibacter sp.]
MPTSTFFNLPPPKRERLMRAAVEEFTQKPFNEVSINRIIQAAEIPRGSFYQYFEDKTDLFRFILAYFNQRLAEVILFSLDASGGDLLAAPLTLFDRVLACIRENQAEFQVLTNIVRQNVGIDAGKLWDFTGVAQTVLDRADRSRLRLSGREELLALLDLLLSATAQALMAASCGELTLEEIRVRLANKIAIIRQGAEIKEESC